MSYEKKYKESLERARIWQNHLNEIGDKDYADELNYIFPELKESEDERIRGAIIDHLKDNNLTEWAVWLEKQGEQKPADKIKPKFGEGDWTISNLDKEARQISEVHFDEYNSYYVINGKCVNLEEYDRLHHLWTISDAKDGDVLQLGEVTVIFKKYIGQEKCICYCSISEDGGFEIPIENGEDNIYGCTNTTPATKEQREQLEKAMSDAGFTFDFDKKELKKIEYKYAWNEEDEKMVESIITDIKYCKKPIIIVHFMKNEIGWLKSLKDKVQPLPKQEWSERDELMLEASIGFIKSSPYPYSGDTFRGEISKVEAENWLKSLKDKVQPQSKQEWSEEDESMHTRCIGILGKCYMGELPTKVEEELNWLKSLKSQNTWKPSDEQMYALDNARHSNPFDIHILDTLFHDLYKIIY